MLITLPDESAALLDPQTLSFEAIPAAKKKAPFGAPPSDVPFGINCRLLAECMSNPAWKFGDCFRRISDHPRYSPKGSVHKFDVCFLTSIYKFKGDYRGGTFSSSTTEWRFLDGGIISHYGYGWGSHSWTVIEGCEALRAVCLFFGVKQPRSIKGEGTRRPLAVLLEEMTSVPLQERRGQLWNLPERLQHESG